MIELAKIPTVQTWEIHESDPFDKLVFQIGEASRSITKHLYDIGKKKIAFLGMDRADELVEGLESADQNLMLHREAHRNNTLQIPNIGYPDAWCDGLKRS